MATSFAAVQLFELKISQPARLSMGGVGGVERRDKRSSPPVFDTVALRLEMSAFGPIALTLSGGGGRAVGFHLGVLDCLNRLGILEDVRIISSASGGSFIGSTYAISLKQRQPFEQYYAETLRALREGQVLQWVLERLAQDVPRAGSGRRNFVTGLADAYDRHFFQGARFGLLLDDEPRTHLGNVVINATEAKYALAFRFQTDGDIGNDRIRIDRAHARHMRMADVMAASSCVPGGLEPLMFPQDFVWEGEEARRASDAIIERLRAEHGVDSIPLMDGGVYDNQGIEGVLLTVDRWQGSRSVAAQRPPARGRTPRQVGGLIGALARRAAAEGDGIGLFIVSDAPDPTDPVYREAYQPGDERPLLAREPPAPGGLTLGDLYRVWWVLLALCGLTFASLAWNAVDAVLEARSAAGLWRDADDVLARLMPLALTGGAVFALVWLRRRVRDALQVIDHVLQTEGTSGSLRREDGHAWQFLRPLTVRDAGAMLAVRATSLMALVSDIFMDRIRALGYALLRGAPTFKDRVVPTEIYDLYMDRPDGELPEWLRPTPELVRWAEYAARLPTTLWYEHAEDLDILLEIGRATVCYNLLRHITRRQGAGEVGSPERRAVEERARRLWEESKKRVATAPDPATASRRS
jgi:predicted acylesterase/phospholipase RssA